jgi:hypothetical protein
VEFTSKSVSFMLDTLSLLVLGCHVRVQCQDASTQALLLANYGQMQGSRGSAALHYTVGRRAGSGAFLVSRAGREPLIASDAGELLFLFEKDMTVELEQLRPDLYFVHAAVLVLEHKAVMLVGESGSGKSTTTWALLHHGYGYLSDELGPVDLRTCEVYPYPHALCLKDVPPGPYPLPKTTLYTSRTLHIPTADLPGQVGEGPVPLAAIFFLQFRPEATVPVVAPVSKAEAAARLFANALNPLAHRADGLEGAIMLATKVSAVRLLSADLTATCATVQATLNRLLETRATRRGLEGPWSPR